MLICKFFSNFFYQKGISFSSPTAKVVTHIAVCIGTDKVGTCPSM